MPVPSTISDLNVNAANNSPAGTDSVTTSTGPDEYLRALSAIIRREQAQGAAVASAATVDLGAISDGNYVHITGTTTITSFGTAAAGIERTLVFDGALTLTHNATSLILPAGENITTKAGDVAVFRSEGSGNWRCIAYTSAADVINYTPAGTSAVTRTVQDKLREFVSVKDFGAVGDGVTDDTTAINNWLSYIVANNKIGTVPSGTYLFTAALTGGVGNNWGIVGEGSAAVTFLYGGANTTNDIWTIGDGTADIINILLAGFKLKSNTTMTSGIGLHIKRMCRSSMYDVIIDGQDGNGKLWHGIRFNGLDNVHYEYFETRAQKDGLQVNGLTGSNPKAGLFISHYKIASCDVGVRVGGAFGGINFNTGDIIANNNNVVIDTTLVAEINREVFFSPTVSIDSATYSNVVIDQALSGSLYVNFPSGMWLASSGSHNIWIKNANSATINIDAYIYNNNGDGIRIDDASTVVRIGGVFANITQAGTYAVNATVATTNVLIDTRCLYSNVLNTWNYTFNRAVCNLSFPINVQGGRSIYWDNYSGTLDASGNATFPHGKGASYYKQVIAMIASAKSTGGAWYQLTPNYIDGTNISISGSSAFASQPYNVVCLVGDTANTGW